MRRKAHQEHPEGLFLLCKLIQPQKRALSGEPPKSRTETAHFQKKNCSKLASCVSTDDIVLDQVHVLYVIAESPSWQVLRGHPLVKIFYSHPIFSFIAIPRALILKWWINLPLMALPKEALGGCQGRFLSLFLAFSNINPNLLLEHTSLLGCRRFITGFGHMGSEKSIFLLSLLSSLSLKTYVISKMSFLGAKWSSFGIWN